MGRIHPSSRGFQATCPSIDHRRSAIGSLILIATSFDSRINIAFLILCSSDDIATWDEDDAQKRR